MTDKPDLDYAFLFSMEMKEPNYNLNRYDRAWCIGYQKGWNECLNRVIAMSRAIKEDKQNDPA